MLMSVTVKNNHLVSLWQKGLKLEGLKLDMILWDLISKLILGRLHSKSRKDTLVQHKGKDLLLEKLFFP